MKWVFRHPWISAAAMEALLVLVGICAFYAKSRAGELVMGLLGLLHLPATFLAAQITQYCSSREQLVVTVILMLLFWVALIALVDLTFRRKNEVTDK